MAADSPIQTETLGYGWILQKGNTSDYATTTTWTTVCSELTEIKVPEFKVTDIPTHHFTSVGQNKTFTPGWGESGEAEISAHYVYAEVTAINALFRVINAYRIVAPYTEVGGLQSSSSAGSNVNGQVQFNGYINSLLPAKLALEGLATIDFKIKINGLPAFS